MARVLGNGANGSYFLIHASVEKVTAFVKLSSDAKNCLGRLKEGIKKLRKIEML